MEIEIPLTFYAASTTKFLVTGAHLHKNFVSLLRIFFGTEMSRIFM